MKWLLSLLTSGVADKLAAAYQAKHDAQTEQDRIAAEVQIARITATQGRGWMYDALVFVTGLPLALHLGAVCFVSVFPALGLVVHALPEPMNEWQGMILLSLFGLSGVARIFRR